MKTAIVNCGHPGSFESLYVMLRAAGWDVLLAGPELRDELKRVGCDTVTCPQAMAEGWGGELRMDGVGWAIPADMTRPGVVYVDVKAHRNGPKVVARWPDLKDHVLWYRINGGEPCDIPGKGPELNPGCPVLTPDLWYSDFPAPPTNPLPKSTLDRSYTCWPPFARWEDHQRIDRADGDYSLPFCLIHNAHGWGYGGLMTSLRLPPVDMRVYGGYGSPDGMLKSRHVPQALGVALCMVHLKSVDAPGYALYEALAGGCPVILPRRFNHRCRTFDLFVEGETCLMFDFNTDGAMPVVEPGQERLVPIDVDGCVREVTAAVERLRDPRENRRIGEAGRFRLAELMWDAGWPDDVESLKTFLGRMFP